MKQLTITLFLVLILPFSYLLDPHTSHAQKLPATSVMTLASVSNNNTGVNTQSIENKTVNYYGNTTGYLTYPSPNQGNQQEKLPAVVMIHENKGLNDYIKDSANILAKSGYVVLAVDLFNGEISTDQDRSRELTSDTKALSNIQWPVLGIFGDKDMAIPVDTVKQFQQALTQLGIQNEIYIYPGVGHAFANPSNPNYAPNETADSWKKTLNFLNKYVMR